MLQPAVPLESAEALILTVTDLQDRDRIVVFLTREHGKKKGVAKGSRARHSRFAGQLQPLGKAAITWFQKEGGDLVRISSVELIRPAGKLLEDLDDILLGSYLAEHLVEFAQEDEASEALYRLLDATLEALIGGVDRDAVARYFEAWVLRLAGIFPAPRDCPECGGDLSAKGAVLPGGGDGLLCPDCGGREGRARQTLLPGTIEFLLRIGRVGPALAAEPPPGEKVLRQVEVLCAEVRCGFLQHELKSRLVLEQIRGR
jgi:DNA repair protein RecO (recombination protein O)